MANARHKIKFRKTADRHSVSRHDGSFDSAESPACRALISKDSTMMKRGVPVSAIVVIRADRKLADDYGNVAAVIANSVRISYLIRA